MEHFHGPDWAAKLTTMVFEEAEKKDAGELPADAPEVFRAPLLEGESADDYEGRSVRAGPLVLNDNPGDLTAEETRKLKVLQNSPIKRRVSGPTSSS